MLWRAIQIFLALLNLAVVALVGFWVLKSPGTALSSPALEYKDFVSILLSALAAMIAVLTLFLAVVALWGYAQLKEEARRVAKEAAEAVGKDAAETVATFEARRAAEEFMAKLNRDGGGDYGAAAGGASDPSRTA